jgi:SOUL heme-binding protein
MLDLLARPKPGQAGPCDGSSRSRLSGAAAFASGASAIEEMSYRVEASYLRFEVRDYPSTLVAEVVRRDDRNATVNSAFPILAAYIFAKDRGGAKISMTAPVFQTPKVPAPKPPATLPAAGLYAS